MTTSLHIYWHRGINKSDQIKLIYLKSQGQYFVKWWLFYYGNVSRANNLWKLQLCIKCISAVVFLKCKNVGLYSDIVKFEIQHYIIAQAN